MGRWQTVRLPLIAACAVLALAAAVLLAFGTAITANEPSAPPDTPASVTVARSDGSLDASWDAVNGATSYHITYSSDNGASWKLAALNHPDSSIAITGVDNAATYIVGVRARNAHGDSGWRNSPPAGPYAPPKPTPTPEPRPTPTPEPEPTPTPEPRPTPTPEPKPTPTPEPEPTPTPEPEPTPTPTPEPAPPPAVPAAPTGLTATAGDASVTLTWDDPSDSTITGYEYQVNHNDTSTGNLSGWGQWTAIPGSGAATTSHTLAGLTNGREYRYHLRAVNTGGPGEAAPNAEPWYVNATPEPAPPGVPAAPTGLKGLGDDASATLSWDAAPGADITGYEYQQKDATANGDWGEWTAIPAPELAEGGAETSSYNVDGLTNGSEYHFRLRAVNDVGPSESAPSGNPDYLSVLIGLAQAANTEDYDDDDDGLIEVESLAQLNAIRWDLDGDGTASSGNETSYSTAFPNPLASMGCGSDTCTGYELAANLDFDTDGNGVAASGDTYWNGGAGWNPIDQFAATFDGNNDTDSTGDGGPFTISNLFVNRTSNTGVTYAGLFGRINSGATVRNVALYAASVTGGTTGAVDTSITGDPCNSTINTYAHASVGILAGENSGTVSYSHSQGVANSTSATSGAHDTCTWESQSRVGGLVGHNVGTILYSYSGAEVFGLGTNSHAQTYSGGLVGINRSRIGASYATGDVHGIGGHFQESGGLVGLNNGSSTIATGSIAVSGAPISASYATGDVTSSTTESAPNSIAAAGLVGFQISSASVTASYSTGNHTVTTTLEAAKFVNGLVNRSAEETSGGNNLAGNITNSYWDSTTYTYTDNSDCHHSCGTGQTTSNLQSPTGYTGIYAAWDVDVDGAGGNDDPWNFGTSSQYPVIKYPSAGGGVTPPEDKQRTAPQAAPGTFTITQQTDTELTVSWTASSGASGYRLQWRNVTDSEAYSSSRQAVVTTLTRNFTGLTAQNTYAFRVVATKDNTPDSEPVEAEIALKKDYDTDGDNLIEINSLAQLNALRWDLDGNGTASSGNETGYATAFPNAMTGMGCAATCQGYELSASLDFDTGTAGDRSDDTYYNSGQGWQPIGGTFAATFEGNTYKISNLHVNRSGANTVQYAGLFGQLGSAASIDNLKLEEVSVTVATNAAATASPGAVYAGGIAGDSAGDITSSYVTGAVKAVQSDLTTASLTEGAAYAGGLVGNNTGDIAASFARGTALAEQESATASLSTYAGGLAGYHNTGSIQASYADVDAEAKTTATAATATLTAGGLVGHLEGGSITASYSTGAPAATGGATPTSNTGGLAGFKKATGPTITNSYWDTDSSGITATGAGAGKTISELQTPTAYGTGSSIYANWNLDLDGDNTNDDPWDFGTASQYPALKYGQHTAADQRVTVNLTANPVTIYESSVGGAGRDTSTTVTATLSSTQSSAVTVTLPTSDAYTLGKSALTIAVGSTTDTTTLTAVNDYLDAANNSVNLSHGASVNIAIVAVTSSPATTFTINDDDILAKPTGLSVNGVSGSGNDTKLKAAWNTVTGADGYYVWWKSGTDDYASSRRKTVSGGSVKSTELTGLTADTEYTVRVSAYKATYDDSAPSDEAKATPGKVDYDTDDDRLIEITTLEQLNAIRHDADGGGNRPDADYTAAFPDPATNMGCPSTCQGYELLNDLDFDTNGNGIADSGDTYWNGGSGWLPIPNYYAILEGNQHEIRNLYINRSYSSGSPFVGLISNLLASGSVAEIRNLYLPHVNITATSTSQSSLTVGGLAANSGNQALITDSYVSGSITGTHNGGGSNDVYVGGFIGNNLISTIRKSYSGATVTAVASGNNDAVAGGLVAWSNSSTMEAIYATGDVTATGSANSGSNVDAGGLVGRSETGTTSRAVYSTSSVSASAGGILNVGGLVGHNKSGSTLTVGWSNGKVTATDTRSGGGATLNVGASVGNQQGTVSEVYWDTDTTGIADDADNNAPEGKTTSELQTPTEAQKSLPNYPAGLYANWNVDVDGVSGNDNPWDFGHNNQYPVLHVRTLPYVLLQEVPTVTWAVANATLCESSKGSDTAACGASPATSTTITPTLSGEWKTDLTYTFPTDATKYTLDKTSVTIPAGSTTATGVTLTAVNNKTDAADATVNLSPTSSHLRQASTVPAITIKDDDTLAKPTGVKLSVDGTKVQVDWTAVTGATGYTVEWSTSAIFAGTPSSATVTTNSHKVTTGLTSGTTYYFRVTATKTGYDDSPPSDTVSTAPTTGTSDYDADNDGLIDVDTLAKLNAIRWDLDGDGVADKYDSNNDGDYSDTGEYDYTTNYAAVFTNAEDNMGCGESVGSISANNTGNPGCTGYELAANLDFNTNSSATSSTNPTGADSGDTYWNSGNGWDPIGGVSGGRYTGDFDGNTYTISNLFIDRSSGDYAGLFAYLNGASGKVVKNVSLVNLDVTLNTSTASSVHVGGLAGRVGNGGVALEDSYTTGRVRGGESAAEPVTLTASPGYSYVGGLVGRARADITGSYSLAAVTSNTKSASTGPNALVGGLVGEVRSSGSVNASYAAGAVTANIVGQNNNFVYAGGLVGQLHGDINASYARGAVTATSDATDTTGITGNAGAGGLVGATQSGSGITASFSTGAPAATGDGQIVRARGLVGVVFPGATVTNAYWDTEASGITDTGAGTGKTTAALKTPTAYGTGNTDIYKDWNLNLDGVTGNDDPWNFGTASEYPVLKYGQLSGVTQRVTVTLTASPLEIWERALTTPSRVNQTTITATPSAAWPDAITVNLPANANVYSLGASTLTINAGSTAAATTTLTAVNNLADASDYTLPLSAITLGRWVIAASTQTITIKDDDELTKPTGLKLSVDGVKIRADWTAVTGATGYKVQWSTSSTFATKSEGTVSSGSTTNYTINPTPALSANTRYYVRVLPTKDGADEPPSDTADIKTHATGANATVDYDADNDGLIEITTLAQLNGVRYDLDGDGEADKYDSNNDGDYTDTNLGEYDYTTQYATAFPNAEDNMGCNESAVTIASNNTGNPACSGYELSNNLDFDDNTAGDRTDDTYYNSGAGWLPIADTASTHNTSSHPYNTVFEGNNYVISNLLINRTGGRTGSQATDYRYSLFAGLFGDLGSSGEIRNLGVEDVSVTFTNSNITGGSGPEVYAGGLVGYSAGEIFKTYVTGTVTATTTSTNGADKFPHAGGLIGRQVGGSITSSYARVTTTATQSGSDSGNESYAGGLVAYQDGGNIVATYARGSATAAITSSIYNSKAHAGGLIGYHKNGEIKSSYSEADASATAIPAQGKFITNPTVNAGGFVGTQDGGNITASYSVGTPSTTTTGSSGTITSNVGGLTGNYSSGTTTNSYWDTEVSGITTTGQGTGKTTSELKTPTAYGTGNNDIYKDWEFDLDNADKDNSDTTGKDDQWHFGTASDYPVLQYHLTIPPQRASVTLAVSPATIWESDTGGSTRATSTTVTATLSGAWHHDVTITPAADATAYTLGAAGITVNAGSTTGTTTLTAVNNFVDAANKSVTLNATTNDPWVSVGEAPSVTINDDDELAKPTGLKLTVDGTKIRVDWTAVTGATGYKVQWNTSDAWTSPSEGTVSSGSTTTYTINPTPALTANTRYYVRVLPTKSGADEPPSDVKDTTTRASAGTGDYDADNDGLIEIANLAQLNAVRWDLDGDGVVDDSANATSYAAAFANAEDNMGCNESVATITAGTGNLACSGYELAANLDFDTDGDGTADSGDTYWNSGAGWTPIGGGAPSTSSGAYTATFDGNSASYTIANLFIDRDATTTGSKYYAGLFGRIDTGAEIKNVKLTGVSVTLENTTTENPQPEVYAGGLVGYQKAGTITGSSVTGTVKAVVKPVTPSTTTTNPANAGGLVGYKKAGDVVSSYARVTVTAEQNASAGNLHAHAGGLTGVNEAGNIIASYSVGFVNAKVSDDNGNAYAGGLVGEHEGGDIKAAYSYAAPKASNSGSSNTSVSLYAAGLVAYQNGGNITASYSTGAPTIAKDGATTGVTEYQGGLVGRYASGTTTDGYWDTETSGIAATGQGTGKTRSELRTPKAYVTGANDIYKDWDIDLDSVTAGTQDGWDFGTASQYPVLKYGLTPADQRVTATLSASPTTIWERALPASQLPGNTARVNVTTVTATLSEALLNAVVVTLPTADAYTLTGGSTGATITIAAGSTTGTKTLTAVNNRVDAADNAVNLATNATADDPRVGFASANPTPTINDDDSLAAPANLAGVEGNVATTLAVTWDPVTGADGYKLQYKLTTADTWGSEVTVQTTACAGTPVKCKHDITGLTVGSLYDVRVWATPTANSGIDEGPFAILIAGAGVDYDADADGLIEVKSLAQLNAIRWDLDGDGVASSGNETSYTAAFPSAANAMGCPNTGCVGYELAADLNFNTNNSTPTATNPTGANSGDTYWNSGAGWLPIGMANASPYTVTAYTGDFDGNTYTISNLFIDRTAGNYAGLFAYLNGGSGAKVQDVALVNVDVSLRPTTDAGIYAGALAGWVGSGGVIVDDSYSTGRVRVGTGTSARATFTANNQTAYVGGLVGYLDAALASSYSTAEVSGYVGSNANVTGATTRVGGLAGHVGTSGSVTASYAGGAVTADNEAHNAGNAHAGGLVGYLDGPVSASYARGDISADYDATATSGITGKAYTGGLVGVQHANVTASFSTGAATATGDNTPAAGGLVGNRADNSATTTNSYWDEESSGIIATGQGTRKTTSQLQTPTAYGTGTSIYKDWNIDLDSVTAGTQDGWDFGTADQYPALKYGGLTAADQRPTVTLTASPTTIYEAVGGATSSTLTATLSGEWNNDVTVTLPAASEQLTVTNSPLSFTSGASGDWSTAQTATVKLASAPAKTIVVDFTRLSANDPEVTPKYLTFTTSDWDMAQSINVKFLSEPTAATTRVEIVKNSSNVTTDYKVNVNAYRRAYDLGSPTNHHRRRRHRQHRHADRPERLQRPGQRHRDADPGDAPGGHQVD